MQFEPIEVKSVSQFLNDLVNWEQCIKKKTKNDYNIYYRGELLKWSPIPSIYREKNWICNEAEMNAEVLSALPEEFYKCNTEFEKLIKLKHYANPSRLVDISKSPLVALYFAIESMNGHNMSEGVVRLCFSKKSEEKYSVLSDTVTLLTALTRVKNQKRVNKYGNRGIANNYENISEEDFLRELKYQTSILQIASIPHNESVLDNTSEIKKSIIVHPQKNTYRIKQQYGLFIMCGDDHGEVSQSYYDFLED